MHTRKALVVGVDNYPTRPLRNCVNDAEEVGGLLGLPEYDFEVI